MLLQDFEKKTVYDYKMHVQNNRKIQETQTSVTSTTNAEQEM